MSGSRITINIGSLVKKLNLRFDEPKAEYDFSGLKVAITETLLKAVSDVQKITDNNSERIKVLLNSLENYGFESYGSSSSGLLLENCKEFIELKAILLK